MRLKDVGRSELGAETYSSELRFQGLAGVGFGVIQLPTANALDVYEAMVAELERLSQQFPPGMKYQVAFNTTDVVQESIREVLKTLAEAIVLVVLVIFIFLQTWRSTIIPTITIPVSLVGAFAFINLLGYSINTLTLFGVILATGIVVDDAIVVIENIERHIQEFNVSAHQAASDAMGEVMSAVIATALVLIAVFVPVAFFPGTTGRLYAQFSMTIAFAVALSAFNALTLTPALSALLLERQTHAKGRFFRVFEGVISGGTHRYIQGLKRAMRVRWAVVLVFVGGPGGDLLRLPQRAPGVRPRRGPGLLHPADPGADRRVAGIHRRRGAAGRADHHEGPRRAGAVLRHGVQLQRRRVEHRPDVRQVEAVRSAEGSDALASGDHRTGQRSAVLAARRDRRGVHAAVDSRLEPVRRVRVPGARSGRHRHQHAGAGDAGARRRRQPVATGPRACSARSRPTIRSFR